MNTFDLTFDEQYEFIKLYDILRDMDFELTPLQESVFEKVMTGITIYIIREHNYEKTNRTNARRNTGTS